ncbi:MAG TPA: ATP-binding protein [Pyrinomonadaceae bacterium]|nr:ATP-binding protein [Pyrinomonadaceae bacterium]
MSTEAPLHHSPHRRVLGRVAPDLFLGRSAALAEIAGLAPHDSGPRGLLVLAAPAAGATELLRQAYDKLFQQHGTASPVYFQWSRKDRTVAQAARRFLHTFLAQLVAHRRDDPAFVNAPPPLRDLIDLADPSDYEWIERVVEAFERARDRSDERALVHLCLSAPQLAAARGARSLVLFDDVHAVEKLKGEVNLGIEIAQVAVHADVPFVLSGLRRGLLDALNGGDSPTRFDTFTTLNLDNLADADARTLVDRLAFACRVTLNEQTRDLIAQQLGGSPLYISAFLQAAKRAGVELTSFLNCQKLYVDELFGGRVNRRFNSILEEIAPVLTTRRALVRVLHDSAVNAGGKSPAEAWRRRLELEPDQLYPVMNALHTHELASFNATFMEISANPVWRDYLRASYRLQVAAEPRALVVADTLIETLKRAPQTMARHYRRASALGLRDLLARFDAQRVPASLLHYDRFSRAYRGADADEAGAGLDAETDLIRLPQIVHAASCESFHPAMRQVCDEERCAVAHGFEAMPYADANEIVWLAAEIEGKMEIGRALTEVWCDRLAQVASACGFRRVRLWLVSPEGFTAEAAELLNERAAFSSSRRQLELLTARLSPEGAGAEGTAQEPPDEFEMVIPMGGDTELISAHTVEQIARRLKFLPEAINQIKTALVEACINASEHSLSPDRKIYQRFRVESDRLVVTVSSRGVRIPTAAQQSQNSNGHDPEGESAGRRGWGLKLIRTLMDEVEFERVDDGTRLRMTKFLPR